MSRHIFIVITNPVSGREEEYNRWYSGRHLQDVLNSPGFVAAQRFKLAADTANGSPGSYLAIYEMETDDPQAAVAALTAAAQSGRIEISPALDAVNVMASIFTPITGRRTARDE